MRAMKGAVMIRQREKVFISRLMCFLSKSESDILKVYQALVDEPIAENAIVTVEETEAYWILNGPNGSFSISKNEKNQITEEHLIKECYAAKEQE